MEAYKKLSNGRHLVITWFKDFDFSGTGKSFTELRGLVNNAPDSKEHALELENLKNVKCNPIAKVADIEIIEPHISPDATRHIIKLSMYDIAQINGLVHELDMSLVNNSKEYPILTLAQIIEAGEFYD